jgi:vacuolar protein sorting-associated protein 3
VTDFQYLNLRIGLRYLNQTAFEDAGDALFRGDMDPRWLMGLWEEWRGVASRAAGGALTTMNTFSGLEPHLVSLRGKTINQIGESHLFPRRSSTPEKPTSS